MIQPCRAATVQISVGREKSVAVVVFIDKESVSEFIAIAILGQSALIISDVLGFPIALLFSTHSDSFSRGNGFSADWYFGKRDTTAWRPPGLLSHPIISKLLTRTNTEILNVQGSAWISPV
ncbi:hypothetical protein LENED_008077 [Lentinula edodes]|uniref:Uncharacterized protein n=1 Tax=Lentinula edodes TaxID=5353 RepID=A0A1Q3EG79_LENED|nr:hypothetical protein LENED_008077 [Lentinula edodes]